MIFFILVRLILPNVPCLTNILISEYYTHYKAFLFGAYTISIGLIFVNTFNSHYVWLTFCRAQPPDYVLKEAKNTSKFFKCIGNVHRMETGELFTGGRHAYQALTEMEYEAVSIDAIVFAVKG